MAKGQSGKEIPENPLLKRLVDAGAMNAITLRGYIGPATTAGNICLYWSLYDLSDSVEVAEGDILDFAELPESVLPLGGTIVWVKKDATITRRSAKSATTVTNVSESAPIADLRQAGRLRMLVRHRAGLSQSQAVCQSYCGGQSYCFPAHI